MYDDSDYIFYPFVITASAIKNLECDNIRCPHVYYVLKTRTDYMIADQGINGTNKLMAFIPCINLVHT